MIQVPRFPHTHFCFIKACSSELPFCPSQYIEKTLTTCMYIPSTYNLSLLTLEHFAKLKGLLSWSFQRFRYVLCCCKNCASSNLMVGKRTMETKAILGSLELDSFTRSQDLIDIVLARAPLWSSSFHNRKQ